MFCYLVPLLSIKCTLELCEEMSALVLIMYFEIYELWVADKIY